MARSIRLSPEATITGPAVCPGTDDFSDRFGYPPGRISPVSGSLSECDYRTSSDSVVGFNIAGLIFGSAWHR